MNSMRRMTRKEIAAYLRQRGIPIGDSTLDKLCMPRVNEGPPVAAWWGRRPLYDPADALAWAEARIRPARSCASQQELAATHEGAPIAQPSDEPQ